MLVDPVVSLLIVSALSFLGAVFSIVWRVVKKDEHSYLSNELLLVSGGIFFLTILLSGFLSVGE